MASSAGFLEHEYLESEMRRPVNGVTNAHSSKVEANDEILKLHWILKHRSVWNKLSMPETVAYRREDKVAE